MIGLLVAAVVGFGAYILPGRFGRQDDCGGRDLILDTLADLAGQREADPRHTDPFDAIDDGRPPR